MVNGKKLEFFVQYPLHFESLDVHVREKNFDTGEIRFLTQDGWITVDPDPVAHAIPPALSLMNGEGQALMNALWDVGVRPSAVSQTDSQVEAMRSHIDDLREIAFKAVGIRRGEAPR